jgi:hypothetical protein
MFGALATYLGRLIGARRELASAEAATRRGSEASVRRMADRLYHQALAEGGWATEVGAVGPDAFRDEAAWLLREVALGNAQAGPPTP